MSTSVEMRASGRLRRGPGIARRTALPVLALAAAVFAVVAGRRMAALEVGWSSGAPSRTVFATMGILALFIALPVLLFAASGARPRRWARAGAAGLLAAYAVAMAPSATLMGFAAWDAVRHPAAVGDHPAGWAAGWAIVRANPDPEAAARRALWWGDTRLYGIDRLGLFPPGIRVAPGADDALALKRMPGFSDVPESTPEAGRYYREAGCWVFRYDTVVAHRVGMPGVPRGAEADPRFRGCDAAPAGR